MQEIEHSDYDVQKAEGNKWHYEQLAKRCITALQKRHARGYYVANREEARAKVLELIPEGASIGIGDSLSLWQIGIFDELYRRNDHEIFHPFAIREKGYFKNHTEEVFEIMRKAMVADVFLSGTNALTLDGKLVSIDQLGNRVAGLIFGSKKCIVVASANKIVKNVDEAIQRVEEVAAPQVVKWHNRHHSMENVPPCGVTGTCSHCTNVNRVCVATVIIDGEGLLFGTLDRARMHVIIVGEDLGY